MPTHAPTGSIDAIIADHANLGAAARIAGSGLYLDDAIVNFGNFLREQLFHEIRMRAAEQNLRAAIFANDFQDQRANAVAVADHFAREFAGHGG